MRTQPQLGRAIEEAREQTDALFRVVRPDSFYERPIAERHRIVFYLGHVEAFNWNLLRTWHPDVRPFHPEFDRLFAFGIVLSVFFPGFGRENLSGRELAQKGMAAVIVAIGVALVTR